jgi:chemotaxis regulatin CheY-phosphate phosphatase CheZ
MESLKVSHPDVYAQWKEFRAVIVGAVLPPDFDARFFALRDDLMNVGMALQVQDITTQQIAGVSHMIESIRKKLAEVLQNFAAGERSGPPAEVREEKFDPNGHFNGDAEYSRAPGRQEDADAIIESWKRGNHV